MNVRTVANFAICLQKDASEEYVLQQVEHANENPIILVRGNELLNWYLIMLEVLPTCWHNILDFFVNIPGDSLFGEESEYEVRFLDKVAIRASDAVQAHLIWFLSFHAFDFCYTKEVQCTLEFIQRYSSCSCRIFALKLQVLSLIWFAFFQILLRAPGRGRQEGNC